MVFLKTSRNSRSVCILFSWSRACLSRSSNIFTLNVYAAQVNFLTPLNASMTRLSPASDAMVNLRLSLPKTKQMTHLDAVIKRVSTHRLNSSKRNQVTDCVQLRLNNERKRCVQNETKDAVKRVSKLSWRNAFSCASRETHSNASQVLIKKKHWFHHSCSIFQLGSNTYKSFFI